MVRCGVCQNVFSGMANLRHVDEILRQRSSARAAAQQVLHPTPRDSDRPIPDPRGSVQPPSGQPFTAQSSAAASAASNPGAAPSAERATRDAAAGERSESPQDFPQTDLRTAFFLPETVFGPITQMASEPARFSTDPNPAPEPITPSLDEYAKGFTRADPAAHAGQTSRADGLPASTEAGLIAGTPVAGAPVSRKPVADEPVADEPIADGPEIGGRSSEHNTNNDNEPAIVLRRPGPDTRIRWAQESEQAKRDSIDEGPATKGPTPAGPNPDLHADAGIAASMGNGARTADADIRPGRNDYSDTDGAMLPLQVADPASRQKRRRKRPADRSDEAIAYFEPDASHIGFSSRAVAAGWLICLFAFMLLVVQLLLGSRNVLAATVPMLRAPLQTVAGWVGLEIEPPRDLQAVTIESFELHAIEKPGQLALSALLRNRAGHAVQWPALEVALTDGQGTLLIRKVLLPREYFQGLPADASRHAESGMNPRAELPLKLTLEARDLAASGYSVTLFYP